VVCECMSVCVIVWVYGVNVVVWVSKIVECVVCGIVVCNCVISNSVV
jgi:hypothetical protein